MDYNLRRKLAAVLVVDAALDHYMKHSLKIPEHTSMLSGNAHTLELLDTPNENAFKRAARMDRDTFYHLVDEVSGRRLLYDTRKSITVERFHTLFI